MAWFELSGTPNSTWTSCIGCETMHTMRKKRVCWTGPARFGTWN